MNPLSIARLPQRSVSLRWVVFLGGTSMAGIALVLLFLLTQATANHALYERYYLPLFWVNAVVAVLLALVIVWILLRLWRRWRQGRFGSRLLLRLAAVFALSGLLPGALIYVVSYQFVARSIESWFDVKVEGALQAGVNLGRTTVDTLQADFQGKVQALALNWADTTATPAGLQLERARDALDAQALMLLAANGRPLAVAGAARYSVQPDLPAADHLRAARSSRVVGWVEGLEEGSGTQASAHVMVRLDAVAWADMAAPRYLYASKLLPSALLRDALAVASANQEYQERALARVGLQRMYIGTLTLVLCLAVFGSVLLAVLLGNQIAAPLLVLAEGVREVAAGNLSPKRTLVSRDELATLTRDFANMTQQLAEARLSVQQGMQQVSAARAHLQTILDNLTAGVVVLDAQGRILSANPGATRILRQPLAAWLGQPLTQVPQLADFGHGIQQQFDAWLGSGRVRPGASAGADGAKPSAPLTERGLDHWQQSFVLHAPEVAGPHARLGVTLVARGAELPDAQRLLVFDDITEVVSAQRAQAWGDVARRLAHEIKNPLTPVQLAAERLARRLSGKLDAPEQVVLDKAVKTIVDQVDAMKRLVNEFRDYARLPSADLKPLDLNALIQDLMGLYAVEATPVPVELSLDADCQPILGDAQQLRQVLHNLLQNAQDANLAAARDGTPQPVRVLTQWQPAGHRVRLVVQDTGTGFAPDVLQRAFEPYVTTKDKGTGLGLAVVKKIADEHGARIDLRNRTHDGAPCGAQVSLSFNAVASAA